MLVENRITRLRRDVARNVSTWVLSLLVAANVSAQQLPGTALLTGNEDCAEKNTRQITAFLDQKLAESEQHRAKHWNRQFTDAKTYGQSVEPNRQRLRHIIGVRDERKPFDAPELAGTLDAPALLAETKTHKIYAIRWPVFETFSGEGLLVEPKTGKVTENIIAIPPAGVTPEQLIGLDEKPDWLPPFTLSATGRAIIPAIVDRNKGRGGRSNRENAYRSAFQLGRHLIGYEVQEILAIVDWLKKTDHARITVSGAGDGGLLALYAAAVDTRIDEAVVGGYFSNRSRLCDEPIDRNVFGLLDQFGDAEIASLIAPRKLIIQDIAIPEVELKSENGGAPGRIVKPNSEAVKAEVERAKKLVAPLNLQDWITIAPVHRNDAPSTKFSSISEKRPHQAERMKRIMNGMERHTQDLLYRSDVTRRQFWKPLDDISDVHSPEFAEKLEWYRHYFATEVIGQWDDPLDDPKPRTRKKEETDRYTTYEVELDVFGGVTTYGLLMIPKGMKDGEKRPVVVCQHGLEGRPTDTQRGGRDSYSGFATELCERGYITFAPQGIFTGVDKFRFNQRQLNSLGKTLFSVMVPQHQQEVNWLGALPFVDKNKIAFYGLSYGGKTAMRVPPLVKGYCLSICSADFNMWNYKNVSLLHPSTYLFMHEYEIFEFDLANTFDYSEMARLIAPRPFMVERGYRDGVSKDEYVAFEYIKVYDYYAYRLGITDRTEIHWFNGGHKINGEKTYPFLDRFLK